MISVIGYGNPRSMEKQTSRLKGAGITIKRQRVACSSITVVALVTEITTSTRQIANCKTTVSLT